MQLVSSASNSFPEVTTSRHWHGNLRLTFALKKDVTHLVSEHVQAPLKVQRPFYPEGAVCHCVGLHTAGGIVGGDRLSYDLHLQPHAHALLTTAAAGKIYRTNGEEARQMVKVRVESGACLEWLPQETIVFEQAIYRQDMRIELAPGAIWMGWDITRFGRSARGEKFLVGNWRSHTEVWQEDRPLWVDRQWLPGSEEVFYSSHGLAGCAVVGSFAFVGQTVDPQLLETARELWAGEGEVGITRLMSGLLCRYRGNSTLEARQWFLTVWQLVRQTYLQRSVCLPRVWQLEQRC